MREGTPQVRAYVHECVYIHIYIYIEREKVCLYTYMYRCRDGYIILLRKGQLLERPWQFSQLIATTSNIELWYASQSDTADHWTVRGTTQRNPHKTLYSAYRTLC